MDWTAALGSVGTALSIAKAMKEIDAAYDKAAYKGQIAELLSSLADVKVSVIEAQEELRAKDAEIDRLKRAFEERGQLEAGLGSYKYKVDQGRKYGYPICPKCEQTDGRVVQMLRQGGAIRARCPVCAMEYQPVEGFPDLAPERQRTIAQEEAARQQAQWEQLLDERRGDHPFRR